MQIEAAKRIGAHAVELHTGHYCNLEGDAPKEELEKISDAAIFGRKLGLDVHAGHGLNYKNVSPIAAISEIVELNIGHFLIGEAVFIGLKEAIVALHA